MKNKHRSVSSRRSFIYQAGLVSAGYILLSESSIVSPLKMSCNMKQQTNKKLGIALVGLGSYSEGQLAPALQQTEHCYLAGIVTGTPSKIDKWKSKYGIADDNVYNYENFDTIKNNPAIDIIYVVLPNAMHAEYTIRAAEAGKHVICEKPMAISVSECEAMIAACEKAGKKLSIGYRLHFEPYNKEMMRLGQDAVFGKIKTMKAGHGFTLGNPNQWRLNKALSGGGPLQDVGIYCVQGFCYTTGLKPIAVTAQEGPKTDMQKFSEVEQSIKFQLEMPGNIICNGETSYAANMNYMEAIAESGSFEIQPAFSYSGQRGRTSNGPMNFPQVNQQALQMDDFALAINHNRPTTVPGEMGRRDVAIIEAIYKAAATGKREIVHY